MSAIKAGAPVAPERARIPYLESVRGLAAVQVVMLHLVSAFAPALVADNPATHSWAGYLHATPLAFLYDGNSAVFFFFVLSGYVLTPAFKAYIARPARLLASRLLRLAIPVFAACLLAVPIYSVFGGYHRAAGLLTGSRWLISSWNPDQGLIAILRDGVVNALFLGYRSGGAAAAMGFLPDFLQSPYKSYVAPFWTLSIEVFGSVLVLLLVLARRQSRAAWLLSCGVLTGVLLWTPFLAFIVGHVAAVAQTAERQPRDRPIITMALIVAGFLALTGAEHFVPAFFPAACDLSHDLHLPCAGGYDLEKTLGATLILAAVMRSAALRSALSRPALVGLGRFSFPVYLIHWSFIMGVGAFVVVVTSPLLGVTAASLAAAAVSIILTAVGAPLFALVDQVAVRLSRSVRKRELAGRSAAGPCRGERSDEFGDLGPKHIDAKAAVR